MKPFVLIESIFLKVADQYSKKCVQPVPALHMLENCKIISHRGEYNNTAAFENTLPAFDQAKDIGVWGVEFDLRWTKDLQPVVFHDADLQRLFDLPQNINAFTLGELKKKLPLIPTLEEVIKRYGKSLHFMIEIKKEFYPDPEYQNNVLKELLLPLKPVYDYHFISLHPEMFKLINFVPSTAFLPVARLNPHRLSTLAVKNHYGGITGHYLFLTDNTLMRHKSKGQCIGTGFVDSKNCLYRELNRGVEWIFSNNGSKLQTICDNHL